MIIHEHSLDRSPTRLGRGVTCRRSKIPSLERPLQGGIIIKQSITDTVDKYTILLLKKTHGLDVEKELSVYENLIIDGVPIGEVDFENLYQINSLMWDLEDQISVEMGRPLPVFEAIGRLYSSLRLLSVKRIEAKNALAETYGDHLERKNY